MASNRHPSPCPGSKDLGSPPWGTGMCLGSGEASGHTYQITYRTSVKLCFGFTVLLWHKYVPCSVWDTLRPKKYLWCLRMHVNQVSCVVPSNLSWSLTAVVLAGGPPDAGACEPHLEGTLGCRPRRGGGPASVSPCVSGVGGFAPPPGLGPQVTPALLFPQLAGGVILGVALWLRHDPQTTSLLYLELGDKPAPNTFYVGKCTGQAEDPGPVWASPQGRLTVSSERLQTGSQGGLPGGGGAKPAPRKPGSRRGPVSQGTWRIQASLAPLRTWSGAWLGWGWPQEGCVAGWDPTRSTPLGQLAGAGALCHVAGISGQASWEGVGLDAWAAELAAEA